MKKKLKKWLIKIILRFKNYKIENAIIICSEARGGSTWLMELLRNVPGTIINWEPLHVNNGVVPKVHRLGWRPLLKPEDHSSYSLLFRDILELKRYNNWTLRFVDMVDLKPSKYVLTKFVRANNVLPWLVNNFPQLKHPPIFLMRHPITTSISRLKSFEPNNTVNDLKNKKDFVVPDCINNERYIQHQVYVNALESALEYEVAVWCMNNAHLMEHDDRDHWITVYYEHLVLEPALQLKQLTQQLGLTIPKERLDAIDFRKASATNYRRGLKDKKKEQVESFLDAVDATHLDKLQAVFDYFNFKTYTAHSAYPVT